MVAGVNNGSGTSFPQILANAYNLIAVGVTSGNGSLGPTTVDVPGRSKPDIVAPAGTTSTATAWISGSAALLLETAETLENAGGSASASRPETIKAVLMAGAVKTPFDLSGATTTTLDDWSHTPEQPLDLRYGAGQVNVLNSYIIMSVGQQPVAEVSDALSTGWDLATVAAEADSNYVFEIPEGYLAVSFSAIATWNRKIVLTPGVSYNPATLTPSLANVDLFLNDYSGTDEFGAEEFEVIDSSISTIDNVEHIYQTWLDAGRYEMSLTSDADWEVALAWTADLVLLGDANRNDAVDGADYTLWADNYLASDANWGQGDFNVNGIVDGADYTLWADHFQPEMMIITPVPEPPSIATAMLGLLLATAARRFQKRAVARGDESQLC
jgi:hypothetical protein